MHHLFLLVASSVTIQAALLQDIRNQPYSNHHDDPAGAIVKGLHYDPVGAVGWLADHHDDPAGAVVNGLLDDPVGACAFSQLTDSMTDRPFGCNCIPKCS